MGRHPTEDYGLAADDYQKQALIYQQQLRSKIIIPWIRKSLTTDATFKLRDYKTSYDYNGQYDGSVVFFVIFKIVRPDTHAG